MPNFFSFKTFLVISLIVFSFVIFQDLKNASQDYLFAYPLVIFEQTKLALNATNTLIHKKEFPTPDSKAVVRPNVDTLYSLSFLDLTEEPMYLMMPDTNDRYYLLQFMDAWTNVIGSYGKRTTGTQKQEFLITKNGYKGDIPQGFIHVESPTNDVWLLVRIQTNNNEDIPNVTDLQTKMILNGFNRNLSNINNNSNSNSSNSPDSIVNQMNMSTFFQYFSEYLIENPPLEADFDMVQQLKSIGIEGNQTWNADALTYRQVLSLKLGTLIAKEIINYAMIIFSYIKPTINGWSYRTTGLGVYGTQYLVRAIVAHIGLGANLPEDAVYCLANKDENNEDFNGDFNYVLHFDKEDIPPVNGFWSLTLYDENSFLVDNEINRYAIKDRDQLRFNEDGSLDIFIQSERPQDSDNFNNWLPSPKKTKFNLTLRLYWPKDSVFDKTWTPRAVKKSS